MTFSKGSLPLKEDNDYCLYPTFGLIHYSFLNPGKTINVKMYCSQIDAVYQKQFINEGSHL